MGLERLKNNRKLIYRYMLLLILILLPILSDILIQQSDLNFQLSISSIFLFFIIGFYKRKSSLMLISIINVILFYINGFNILTLIETVEIYYIWVLYKKSNKNIVVSVIAFWCLFALPMIFIVNYFTGNNQSVISNIFLLLIFTNRIFNGLISEMFLQYVPYFRVNGIYNHNMRITKLSDFLTNVGTASIVVPIIIFALVSNSSSQRKIMDSAVQDLHSASSYVNEEIALWSDEEKSGLELKSPIEIHQLMVVIKNYLATSDNSVVFYLVDMNNKVVFGKNENGYMIQGMDWLKEGSISVISEDTYKWINSRESDFIVNTYDREQGYFYVTSISGLKVILATSDDKYSIKYMDTYLSILNILVPLAISFGLFIMLLKRYTINAISRLINITNGLPEKIRNDETIIFEKSNIYEVDSLVRNFQNMVDNLRNMIITVEDANKKLRESERKLFDQAHFDFLTGLPNRQYFIEYVGEIIKNFKTDIGFDKMQGVALFFIDLDKFKIINDTKGHSAGDCILQEVASRMNDTVKVYDSSRVFVARLGGDEFVVKFIYEDKEEIARLADSIIEALNKPISIQGDEFNLGCSIGIGLYPEDGEDIETLFMKSDASMYISKSSGGNKFTFYS